MKKTKLSGSSKRFVVIIWKSILVVGVISIFGIVASAAIDTWILSPDIPPTPEVELSLADRCAKATTYPDSCNSGKTESEEVSPDDKSQAYSDRSVDRCITVELSDLNEDREGESAVSCHSQGTGSYRDITILSTQKKNENVVGLGSIIEGGGRGAVLKDMNNDGHLDLVSFLRFQDDNYSEGDEYDSKTCLLQRPAKISDEENFEILSPYVAYYNSKEKSFDLSEALTACIYDPKEMRQFESLVSR